MIENIKNQTELSGLYFIYRGSTNLEKKGWYGLSHLGEHLKCKAFDDLQDDLQSNGINWNAYTSDNLIVFYFTGLEEYLAPFRRELINRMYLPVDTYVDVDVLENEKKIVLEEYQDSFTNQNEIFYLNLFRKKFNNYSPIGLKEDIENYTMNDILEFFQLQYQYPDTIINISKDFVLEMELKFEDRSQILRNDWKENLQAPLEIRGDFPESLCLYYYQSVDPADIPIIKLINSMLGNGLNSPLYQEIREKRALCYQVGTFLHEIGSLPLNMMMILTSPEKEKTVNDTLKKILDQKEKYLNQNRLDTIRKSMIISNKKNLINRHKNISDLIDPNTQKLNSILEKITLQDIYLVYDKYYQLESFTKVSDKNF